MNLQIPDPHDVSVLHMPVHSDCGVFAQDVTNPESVSLADDLPFVTCGFMHDNLDTEEVLELSGRGDVVSVGMRINHGCQAHSVIFHRVQETLKVFTVGVDKNCILATVFGKKIRERSGTVF
jgi:hypothetical protein